MSKKLNIKEYEYVPVEEGEETFNFLMYTWNISKIIKYIKETQKEPNELPIESFKDYPLGFISIDESHVDEVDLSIPIIIIEFSPNNELIIVDGNHRLRKAQKSGKQSISAYILSFEEQLRFIVGSVQHEMLVNRANGLI
jgi:uncharacterized protein (DUF1015 family)